jgi:hypothetical protein
MTVVAPVVIPTTLWFFGAPKERISGSPTVTKKFVGPASGSLPIETYASLPIATILIASVLCANAPDFWEPEFVVLVKAGSTGLRRAIISESSFISYL